MTYLNKECVQATFVLPILLVLNKSLHNNNVAFRSGEL